MQYLYLKHDRKVGFVHTMLALLGSSVSGSNPFTTTVVPLTGKNWSVMENSPHLWIVNVCRQS